MIRFVAKMAIQSGETRSGVVRLLDKGKELLLDSRKAGNTGFIMALFFAVISLFTENYGLLILAGVMVALGVYLRMRKSKEPDNEQT